MSDNLNKAEYRLGYLLLRDGHAVPLRGISPDDIKAGAKHRVLNPDNESLPHRRTLNAIVDRLGFSGDFGTFLAQGWPQFQRFLKQNNCTHRAGVFPVDHGGCIDLNFGEHLGPRPRQLADRIFEAGLPIPSRVFLGYGVDWAAWDRGRGYEAPECAIASLTADKDTAHQRAHDLFARRLDLMGQWGFIDDKLVHGPLDRIVDKSYWPPGSERSEREAQYADVVAAVRAFRAVFDVESVGWVDVLHYNRRLVVLRGHDGGWDLLWRNYREKEPPQPNHVGQSNRLAVEDLPSRLMGESDLRRAIHFRQEVWEENEEHEAEQAFYDRGRSIRERQMTSDADVRIAWLREQGKMPKPERAQWSGPLPNGFRAVTVNGRKLAISEVINVGSFRQMLVETGYADRRADTNESWERANEGEPDDASGTAGSLPGERVNEPVFGLPAVWIDDTMKENAAIQGYTIVDAATVLTTHFTELVKENMAELLTFGSVRQLIDDLPKQQAALVSDISPSQITISGIQRILQNLLRERISIRDFSTILEAIAEATSASTDLLSVTEHVRARLARQLCNMHVDASGALPVVALSPNWEQTFAEAQIGRAHV